MSKVRINLEQLATFAETFRSLVLEAVQSQGVCVALEGPLGSGKTTFVAHLIKILNPNEKVSSPTYVLENIYEAEPGLKISHWDLYRLSSGSVPEELYEAVIPGELRLIEWASRSNSSALGIDIQINFEIIAEDSRDCLVEVTELGARKEICF